MCVRRRAGDAAPPSRRSRVPVIHAEASLARNSAAPRKSSAYPARPSGVFAASRRISSGHASAMSVSTAPGRIALQRTVGP